MRNFKETIRETLTDRFGLGEAQIEELRTLTTPPSNWRTHTITNRNNKPLRVIFAQATSPKATIILAQGRAQTAEEWIEFAGRMNALGYNFVTYDPQGQGLSYRHGDDNTRHHVDTWQTETNDLADVLTHVRSLPQLDNTPKFLVGHSRGCASINHLLSQSPKWQGHLKGVVHIAPLVDIQIPKHLRLMAPFIIAKHQFTRSLTTHAPNQGEFTTDRCLENLPVLSTDPVRRAVQWTIFQDHPQMISGGPTVGFVRAAFEAVKEFKNPATPQSITIPTWFALAGEEAVNDNEAAITFANHMPDASISVYENAQHQIHMERDTIRDPFYRDLGCFIKKHLP